MHQFQKDFIQLLLKRQILLFGDFTLKSGKKSAHFFNFGLLNDGQALQALSTFYAQTLIIHQIDCDVIYGPAYKGIPIASGAIQAYFQLTGRSLGFAYRRKEIKNHGEGGNWVGSSLEGKRILIMDDVVAQGTAMKESINHLKQCSGAKVVGMMVALDRQDIGSDGKNEASKLLASEFQVPFFSGIKMSHLFDFVSKNPDLLSLEQREIFKKIHLNS